MRDVTHPGAEQFNLPEVLHALSDPVRLEIVAVLSDGEEMSCGRLCVPVSKSTLTHHLKVLREAGVTHTRIEGVQRLVSLRREDLDARFPGLLSSVLAGASRNRPAAAPRHSVVAGTSGAVVAGTNGAVVAGANAAAVAGTSAAVVAGSNGTALAASHP